MRIKVLKAVSTVLGVGYMPIAPGTFGSLAGLIAYFAVFRSLYAHVALICASLIAGFIVCRRAKEIFGSEDPKEVVIDEFTGMLITYLFVPISPVNIALGFILFRLFDITKAYPARRLELVKGGAGIMLDDILAAVYANIILIAYNSILVGAI